MFWFWFWSSLGRRFRIFIGMGREGHVSGGDLVLVEFWDIRMEPRGVFLGSMEGGFRGSDAWRDESGKGSCF